MKKAIVLCFLAIFCTVDATLWKLLLIRVRSTKWSVESTIRQLDRLRDDVQQETDLKIMNKLLENMEGHKNYVDPILDAIRKEVEEAKAKGKKAQPCYDAALNIVRNIEHDAYTKARQCQETAKCSIRTNLGFIDHLILIGRGLISDLDDIFPNCYENNSRIWDILKLRSCINSQLGISKIGVKNLQSDAKSAKSTSTYASSIVIQQGIECLTGIYSNARSKVAEATSAAARCLKAL